MRLLYSFFNAADSEKNITFNFDEHRTWQAQYGTVGTGRSGTVRDVWKKKDLGTFWHNFTARNVMPHASMFLKVKLL